MTTLTELEAKFSTWFGSLSFGQKIDTAVTGLGFLFLGAVILFQTWVFYEMNTEQLREIRSLSVQQTQNVSVEQREGLFEAQFRKNMENMNGEKK